MNISDKITDVISRIERGEPKEPLLQELRDIIKSAIEKPFIFDVSMLPDGVRISDIIKDETTT